MWGSESGLALEGVKAFCTRRTFNPAHGRLVKRGVNLRQCAGVLVRPGAIVFAAADVRS